MHLDHTITVIDTSTLTIILTIFSSFKMTKRPFEIEHKALESKHTRVFIEKNVFFLSKMNEQNTKHKFNDAGRNKTTHSLCVDGVILLLSSFLFHFD